MHITDVHAVLLTRRLDRPQRNSREARGERGKVGQGGERRNGAAARGHWWRPIKTMLAQIRGRGGVRADHERAGRMFGALYRRHLSVRSV